MFSYRHAFHAGNHADALKHITLLATLRHLMRKPAPLTLVDTHAGVGLYRLDDAQARTSGEARAGIARLQALHQPTGDSPATDALQDYLSCVAAFNADTPPGKSWRTYPGSPLLMHALMRADAPDRLRLFELHPKDSQLLHHNIEQLQLRRLVRLAAEDGFAGLKALLPPPPTAGGSRRALVLIDPSYEIKSDYAQVAAAVQDSLRRFVTGVYLVWWPIIARPEAQELPRRLKTLARQAGRDWLQASLQVGQPAGKTGLNASGMFVINPPHNLQEALQQALPQVLKALQDETTRPGHWRVEASG